MRVLVKPLVRKNAPPEHKALHHRGYNTPGDRRRAITQLRKHGYNYFVTYRDTRAPIALHYSWAAWVTPGTIYVI